MKKVNILGHILNVAFNMAVEIEYEEMSGQPFDIENMSTQKATMQLCYASLKESNDKMPFKFDELKAKVTMEEWVALKNAVIEAMTEWFHIPVVMQEDEHQKGEDGKNS